MVPIIGHIPLGLNSALELWGFSIYSFSLALFFNPFYFPIWQLEHTTGKLNRCDKEPGNPFVVKNGVNVPHAHVNKCISIPNTSVYKANTTYVRAALYAVVVICTQGRRNLEAWLVHAPGPPSPLHFLPNLDLVPLLPIVDNLPTLGQHIVYEHTLGSILLNSMHSPYIE